MVTQLSHQQWKRDENTLELLPYLSSLSPLNLSCRYGYLSFFFTNSHVDNNLSYNGTQDVEFKKIEEGYVEPGPWWR